MELEKTGKEKATERGRRNRRRRAKKELVSVCLLAKREKNRRETGTYTHLCPDRQPDENSSEPLQSVRGARSPASDERPRNLRKETSFFVFLFARKGRSSIEKQTSPCSSIDTPLQEHAHAPVHAHADASSRASTSVCPEERIHKHRCVSLFFFGLYVSGQVQAAMQKVKEENAGDSCAESLPVKAVDFCFSMKDPPHLGPHKNYEEKKRRRRRRRRRSRKKVFLVLRVEVL